MAEVHPFRAVRYDPARAGMLTELVAPPYDVIDRQMQDNLYEINSRNVVRLILNKEEPNDTEANNRYTRAAKFLRDWRNEDILVLDRLPALYVCHQEFEADGRKFTRRGFFARVRLEEFGAGRIYPHEQTMPGPKADRLKLFHATGMNLSPIFSMFPDPEQEVQRLLDDATSGQLPLEATDHLGVTSRLWTVTDANVIAKVADFLQPCPIFIADGHHRYETALRYLAEKKQAGEVADDRAPANFVMMILVGMSDPGLVILPTHRLVTEVGDMSAGELRAKLEDKFDCEVIGTGAAAARVAWERIEADGGQGLLAFGTATDQTWTSARLRSPDVMDAIAPDHSSAWRSLAVSILHELVLKKILVEGGDSTPACRFVHLLDEVEEAITAKSCQLAALIPPASMKHVEQIAGGLEKMPPKSTYFYPKILSGLLFNPLQ